jgi:hypothetical protein
MLRISARMAHKRAGINFLECNGSKRRALRTPVPRPLPDLDGWMAGCFGGLYGVDHPDGKVDENDASEREDRIEPDFLPCQPETLAHYFIANFFGCKSVNDPAQGHQEKEGKVERSS